MITIRTTDGEIIIDDEGNKTKLVGKKIVDKALNKNVPEDIILEKKEDNNE